MMRERLTTWAFCLIMWLLSWTALLAQFQSGALDGAHARAWYRRDLGFSMLICAFPPAWIVVPFLTGFYEHGFQIMPRGEKQ